MKRLLTIVSIVFLLALLACGDSADPGETQQAPDTGTTGQGMALPEIDHWLVITDSIGVELGDSNLVFGKVVAAHFLPDGNIAVADVMKTRISIFSPEGEYLATVGRKGSGPGEYLMLTTFATTYDGGLIVPDAMGGKLNFYDSEFNFTDAMTGFFHTPPILISPIEGGFVGLKPEFDQGEEEMHIGMGLYLWTDSSTYEVEYARNMILFDMNDLGAAVKTMVFFDTDRNNNVLNAPYSTEEYVITSLTRDGEQIWQIVEDYPRVKKSDEEIAEERELLRSSLLATGIPTEIADSFQLEEYKVFIGGLEIDNKNRLWVLSGLFDTPVYRVYDCDTSEFLFTAALRADESHENLALSINSYGIMGFEADSDDWSRVYIITPEDPTLFE
ncbi:MAG: 6-bladed beta-propeller [Candidatus Sabulitectum sp.]|nr:6-bladed beta-propeller [Candidatus Sabulitectum sp.]